MKDYEALDKVYEQIDKLAEDAEYKSDFYGEHNLPHERHYQEMRYSIIRECLGIIRRYREKLVIEDVKNKKNS